MILEPGRKTSDWVEAFIEYATLRQGTPNFSLWAAIVAISTMIERKVFTRTVKGIDYALIYTIFVAKPGVGKTYTAELAIDLIEEAGYMNKSPANFTRAGVVDFLVNLDHRDVKRSDLAGGYKDVGIYDQDYIIQTPCLIFAPELTAMIPAYDADLIGHLTTWWDGKSYVEAKRGIKDPKQLRNPTLSMIACTTPGHLGRFFEGSSWEDGFLARTQLVYDNEVEFESCFASYDSDEDPNDGRVEALRQALLHDIGIIKKYNGYARMTRETRILMDEWIKGGEMPKPLHPKLEFYNIRRRRMLARLSIISAVSRASPEIEPYDWLRAQEWLFKTESYLDDALIMIAGNTAQGAIINEFWHWLQKEYTRLNKIKLNDPGAKTSIPISETKIFAYLISRMPQYEIEKFLGMMVKTKMIMAAYSEASKGMGYIPLEAPRKDQI